MTNEELVTLYQAGDKQALNKLVENNGGIITKFANKYLMVNKLLEFDDLFNSGVIGLIKAADKYDLENENKAQFITYAIYYINRYIQNCVRGRGEKEVYNNTLNKEAARLNMYIGEEEENTLEEITGECDGKFENVIEKIFLQQIHNELEEVMKDCLTLKEREVIKMRYGWDFTPMKFEEIGSVLNSSRNSINQIKNNALHKLRNSAWWHSKGIYYAMELKDIVFLEEKEPKYSDVEKNRKQDLVACDFLNKYFSDIKESITE